MQDETKPRCCLQVAGLELLGITHTCSPRQPWHSQLLLSAELPHHSRCLAAGAVLGAGLGRPRCRLQWTNQPVPSLCHALPAVSLCAGLCAMARNTVGEQIRLLCSEGLHSTGGCAGLDITLSGWASSITTQRYGAKYPP